MSRKKALAKSRVFIKEKNCENNYKNNVVPFVPRKKSVDIVPRNRNQETYLIDLLDDNKDIVFGVGPAGCGKTLLGVQAGIKFLKENKFRKFIITRPNVAVDDRDIGFLPGDILQKMQPWLKPIIDIFEEYYSPKEIELMFEEGIIEPCPIAFIRGRTLKNAFIMIDEAQGTTPNSMKSILTRFGESSKMVVTGDLDQSDFNGVNGLQDFLKKYNTQEQKTDRISVTNFVKKDVERHPVVKDVLNMYK